MRYCKLLVLCLLLTCYLHVLGGISDTTAGCSVKNRWTIKASVSGYKCWDKDLFIMFGDFERDNNVRRVNFRLEADYGLTKHLEVGLFAGFQDYKYVKILEAMNPEETFAIMKRTVAPTFGVGLNFHLLPIFVEEKNCRWDLYLTAKYGGCFLPHVEVDELDDVRTHYAHEYGAGLGIAYYIRNRAGFFAEFMFGNYSYFSNVQSSSNFRAGITFKI